jgi:hypothetical protein
MNITNPYDIKQGLMIISPSGSQKYTEALDSYSQILTDLYVSNSNNNRYCIDSCWESGNIYYANYDEGNVKKIKYDGTEIASLTLTNPFMVSVIQNSSSMNSTVTYPPQEDLGCWIADKGTGKIIKTDKDLNIVAELSGITNPVGLKADIDGGCYIVEEHTLPTIGGNLIKISSTAEIMAIKDYSAFSPVVTTFIDMAIDMISSNEWIWFCANDKIYSLNYNNGDLNQQFVLDPFAPDTDNSSSSSESEEKHLGAIDVDRRIPGDLYVSGGNSSQALILKYSSGSLVASKTYYDISFPYIVKVIQGMGSDSLYILEDSAKWDDYGYGSSSSSSSTEVRSSSSSSSSSSGCWCSSYICSGVTGDAMVCSYVSNFSFTSYASITDNCNLWLRIELKPDPITPLIPKSLCEVFVFGNQSDAINNVNAIVGGGAGSSFVPVVYTINLVYGSVNINTSLASGVSIAKMTCVVYSSSSSSSTGIRSSSSSSIDTPFGSGFTTYPLLNGSYTFVGNEPVSGYPTYQSDGDGSKFLQYYPGGGIDNWVIYKPNPGEVIYYRRNPSDTTASGINGTYKLEGGANEGTIT